MAGENVHRIDLDGRQVILVGTAHVSQKSVEEVKALIEAERPDTVCVELCQTRYDNIANADQWRNTDIIKIIKEGKALILLISLIMSSYQKRLARQFGIQPGQEMLQGIQSAREIGANLCLVDRDIQTTMIRLWRGFGFWGKMKLFFQLMMSLLLEEEISEEELEKMKSQDMLTAALNELSASFPEFKRVIIDERDQYIAEKIKTAPGNKVLAVLGAGHIAGIKEELGREHDLAQLSAVPAGSKTTKVIGWIIPALILAIIISTFSLDRAAGMDSLLNWILWNGSLSALGALLALAHPVSILTAFVVAPISSLNPLLAAGWFAGLTEAFLKKPSVKDFQSMSEDIHTLKGFWRNKVTHILLVVALANLGSSIGTVVAGADVISKFISVFR
ncbi:MAG TPA: TraB/GumN family protein [Clostridia bacterium]|nr:TraB/GumN family protein [Clostridia bacterium]